MAVPSAVTLGSLAFVAIAGAGLGVAAVAADDSAPADGAGQVASSRPSAEAPPPPDRGENRAGEQREKRRERPDAVPKTLVDVYNNSGVSGLAAEQAGFLRGAGWNVAAIDNWYGNIPDNTVYFPPTMRADAKALAKTLGYDRLRRAVDPMRFDRLTVIITADR